MTELISVLMPVKNTASYLPECLDSIIHQTYQNWELIAINDHSDDESLSILLTYATQDQRIKVYDNNGRGVIEALRMAYSKSSGEYISRMDSDDINMPQKFEIMSQQIQQAGIGHVALGQVEYFASEALGDGYRQYQNWLNNVIANGTGFKEVYKECVIPSPCWLLHKSDVERCGAFDADNFPEDYDLCFRMYKAGLNCLPNNEVLLRWRDRPMRTTRTDANYQSEKLLQLKCHYFLDIDYESDKQLVLWGAGKRGKFIARFLNQHQIKFHWVCNNDNKIGKTIYINELQSINHLHSMADKQIIVSVSNLIEQNDIRLMCDTHNWEAYFFC